MAELLEEELGLTLDDDDFEEDDVVELREEVMVDIVELREEVMVDVFDDCDDVEVLNDLVEVDDDFVDDDTDELRDEELETGLLVLLVVILMMVADST